MKALGRPFQFSIATPEGVVYAGEIHALSARTQSGEVTILRKHTPMVSCLVPGELRMHKDDIEIPMAVSGGFLEVRTNGDVIVLADTAERAEDIDIERAEQARTRAEEFLAQKDAALDEDFALFQSKLERHLNRITVARRHRRG